MEQKTKAPVEKMLKVKFNVNTNIIINEEKTQTNNADAVFSWSTGHYKSVQKSTNNKVFLYEISESYYNKYLKDKTITVPNGAEFGNAEQRMADVKRALGTKWKDDMAVEFDYKITVPICEIVD